MNNYIIRKVDNLGRIVIPKDIRKALNINEDDEVNLTESEGKLIITKYSELYENRSKEREIVSMFNDVASGTIFLSDRDIFITNGILYNKKVPAYLFELLKNKSEIVFENDEYLFDDIFLKGSFYIVPIIINGIIKGLLMLVKQSKINSDDKSFIKILKNIIEI